MRWMFLGSLEDPDDEELREDDQRSPVFPVNRSAYDRVVSLFCKNFTRADIFFSIKIFTFLKKVMFFFLSYFFFRRILSPN